MVALETSIRIQAPLARCFDLARSVEVHLLSNVHSGEAAIAAGGVTRGVIELDQQVTWRARHLGFRFHLTTRIMACDCPLYFQDSMTSGPFAAMSHDHYFHPLSGGITEMRDVLTFAAPLGPLGRIAEALVLRRYMRRLLMERNETIRQVAESNDWRKYLPGTI